MAGQIIGNCTQEVVHSGRENCSVIPGPTKHLLFHPANALYPLEREAFIEQLPAFLVSDPNTDRITPVGPISGNTPSGGDLVTTAPGNYGGTVTTGVNPTTVEYQIDNGTPCMYKELSKWNRRTMRVFEADDAGLIMGTVRTTGGKEGFAGYLVTIFVREVKATGTEKYQLWINLDYSANYEIEKQNRHGFMLGLENIPSGLLGLRLVAGQNGTATVTTDCGGEDVTAKYGEDWATSTFINSTGSNPTAVTWDGEANALTITPAGEYKVADAQALEAAEISGYEGINTYATITASA